MKDREREIICWFGSQESEIMNSMNEDLLKLQAESNKLKLIATDQMVETFSRLEALNKKSTDKSNEFMGKFLEIILHQNHELSAKLQAELFTLGIETQATSKELMKQMRQELKTI